MSDSGWGKPEDWSKVITGVGEGASSAIQGSADSKTAKRLAKETKRRTLARLFSERAKRKQGLFKRGQEHDEEMGDIKSEALQNTARGLVESLKGTTKRIWSK